MAFNSYTALQTSMGKWLKRPDLASLFPDFINLAEVYISRAVKSRSRRATYTNTPSKNIIDLPSDWDKVIQVFYNGTPMEFFPSGVESGYAGGKAGLFTGYQIKGDKMILNVPSLGGILKIDYYTILESLSSSNETNIILEDAPDIYLYASLHEASLYIRDDGRSQLWATKRDLAIQSYLDDDADAKSPDQPLSMRRG